MQRSIVTATLAAALMAGGAVMSGGAQAAPIGAPDGLRTAVEVQIYMFSGRRYCWYDDAWSGPGWYWCGYAWRNGIGWGGGYGWHSWRGGHPGGVGAGRP